MVKSKYFLHLADATFTPWIMRTIEACRPILKLHQSGQWQGREPSLKTIENDIKNHHFLILFEDEQPLGGVAILNNEPAYNSLLEGQWLNEAPYRVLHRFFIDPQFHGRKLSKIFLTFIEEYVWQQGVDNIRLDTHERNLPMRGLMQTMHYQEVGRVILPHAGERLVYHKVRKKA